MTILTSTIDASHQNYRKKLELGIKVSDVRASLGSGRICLTFYTLPITALTTLGNYLVLLCFS